MTRRCGSCGMDVDGTASVLHPDVGDGNVLCGVSATKAPVLASERLDPVPLAVAEQLAAARIHAETLRAALVYHADEEGAPVEVKTRDGWTEVSALLAPLIEVLG